MLLCHVLILICRPARLIFFLHNYHTSKLPNQHVNCKFRQKDTPRDLTETRWLSTNGRKKRNLSNVGQFVEAETCPFQSRYSVGVQGWIRHALSKLLIYVQRVIIIISTLEVAGKVISSLQAFIQIFTPELFRCMLKFCKTNCD